MAFNGYQSDPFIMHLVARIFWLSQSERKNSAKPQNWPSMSRNVNLVNVKTYRGSPVFFFFFGGTFVLSFGNQAVGAIRAVSTFFISTHINHVNFDFLDF
jgi:hypothetical protein